MAKTGIPRSALLAVLAVAFSGVGIGNCGPMVCCALSRLPVFAGLLIPDTSALFRDRCDPSSSSSGFPSVPAFLATPAFCIISRQIASGIRLNVAQKRHAEIRITSYRHVHDKAYVDLPPGLTMTMSSQSSEELDSSTTSITGGCFTDPWCSYFESFAGTLLLVDARVLASGRFVPDGFLISIDAGTPRGMRGVSSSIERSA